MEKHVQSVRETGCFYLGGLEFDCNDGFGRLEFGDPNLVFGRWNPLDSHTVEVLLFLSSLEWDREVVELTVPYRPLVLNDYVVNLVEDGRITSKCSIYTELEFVLHRGHGDRVYSYRAYKGELQVDGPYTPLVPHYDVVYVSPEWAEEWRPVYPDLMILYPHTWTGEFQKPCVVEHTHPRYTLEYTPWIPELAVNCVNGVIFAMNEQATERGMYMIRTKRPVMVNMGGHSDFGFMATCTEEDIIGLGFDDLDHPERMPPIYNTRDATGMVKDMESWWRLVQAVTIPRLKHRSTLVLVNVDILRLLLHMLVGEVVFYGSSWKQ